MLIPTVHCGVILIKFLDGTFTLIAKAFCRLYDGGLYGAVGSGRSSPAPVRRRVHAELPPGADLHVRAVHHLDKLPAFEHKQEVLVVFQEPRVEPRCFFYRLAHPTRQDQLYNPWELELR